MTIIKKYFYQILIFCVVSIIYFPTFLNPDKVIAGSDITRYFYFYRSYLHNYFAENRSIPVWEPYTFGGRPFYAMIQNAALYPFTYFSAIFSPAAGINLSICFNLILAGIFMSLFVKKITGDGISGFVSGLIFALGGFSSTRVFLGHITIINCIPYLPACFWALLNLHETLKFKWCVAVSLFLSLQFFGGQPQFSFYTIFVLMLFFVYTLFYQKNKIGYMVLFFVSMLLFGLIIFSYLKDVYEFANLTVRADSMGGYDFYTYWSFEPKKIITSVMPFFYGSSLTGDYWRMFWRKLTGFECYNAYLSAAAVFLIFISAFKIITPRVKFKNFFWFLFVFSIIISLGKYTPAYKFFHYCVFGFNKFRWPVRFMFVYMFAGACLAGVGLSNLKSILTDERAKEYFVVKKILASAMIIFIFITASLFFFKNIFTGIVKEKISQKIISQGGVDFNTPEFYINAVDKIYNTVQSGFFSLTLIIVLIGFAVLYLKKFGYKKTIIFISAICAFEIASVHSKFLKTADNNQCVISREIHETFDKNYRIFSNSDMYPPGINVLFNRMSINGYEPFILKKYNEYAKKIEKAKYVPENLVFIKPDVDSKLFDLLSVKYLITEDNLDSSSKFKLLKKYDSNNLRIYSNEKAVPLIFLSEKIISVNDSGKILDLVNDDVYDFSKVVYTSDEIQIDFKNEDGFSCEILQSEIKDDRAFIKVKTNQTAVLNFGYIHYPRWKLKINGKPAKIYNTNYLFMSGILNGPGEYAVEFYFE
ncbi:MAG TPA: hypothetical protein PKY81_03480 [bacterium]|nr:hypothetical protein [bacterium]HPN29997.1 hypothetical protein [bacterium]